MPRKSKSVDKQNRGDSQKKVDFLPSTSIPKGEDDAHCTSYCDEAITYQQNEFRQKMMIAYNILLECKEEKQTTLHDKLKNSDAILKKLNKYTNLPIKELQDIRESVRTRDRTFAKALKDVEKIVSLTLRFLTDDIRSIFVDYIVVKKNFPLRSDLLKQLKKKMSKYTTETITIQRLVKNKLIKFQHFPELNKSLLMEHPENVYERTVYLNNVKNLRSQERNFIYVEVRRIIANTSSGFIVGLAAFPSNGKFEKFFTKDSSELIAKKWLQHRILPLVEDGSVVVIAQPTISHRLTGKKSDIQLWLDEHRIPYDASSHTAELYSLYKSFRGKVHQEGMYDHVFLNAGLTVITCPPDLRKLNFYQSIWADIKVMGSFYTDKTEPLKQKILNNAQLMGDLVKTEQCLIENEYKMLQEDMKMEEIIENVLEMAKEGVIEEFELSKMSSYVETNVCDFIVP